jgi:hypothetical protein
MGRLTRYAWELRRVAVQTVWSRLVDGREERRAFFVLLNQGPRWIVRDHEVAKMWEPRTNFVEQITI